MQWFKFIPLLVLLVPNLVMAQADSFLLAEIVVNTARELEELEELITATQTHTKKMSEFADTVDDYSYRTQRLKSWAEDLKDLSSENPEDLAQINSLLRQIKMIEEDVKRVYIDYSRREFSNEIEIKKYERVANQQNKNTKSYRRQAMRKQKNSAASMQQIAQNTSTMAYEQSKQNVMIAQQNKKIAQLYKLLLEKEKRGLESKSRIQEKYGIDRTIR